MNIGEIITRKLDDEGKKHKWLAEKIGIPTSTMSYKLSKNTFTAVELLQIAKCLEIDLEAMKCDVELQKTID